MEVKKIFTCLLCLFVVVNSYSQTTVDDNVFDVVEEAPEFPGGMTEMMRYLQNNIKYPLTCYQQGIQGRVIVRFVIDTDGSVVNAEVIKSIDPHLDKEALRVVNTMPKWKPGKQKGETVKVRYTLPINFRLTETTKVATEQVEETGTEPTTTAQTSKLENDPSIKEDEVKEPLAESVESENEYPTLSDVFSNVQIKQLSDGVVSFERMFPLIDKETVKKVYLNEFNSDYKFYDGFVCVQNGESGRLGFVNENGEVLKGGFRWHAPSYEKPKFVGGLTIVKEIIPIKDKFALATREEKWYILNKEGETIQLDYPIYQATSFNEDGIAGILIHEDFKYRLRYINSKGEIVFGHLSGLCNQLRNIGSLHDGLATYYDDRTSMYGYINKEGKIVIPAQYDYAEDFSEGLAIVRTNIDGASKHIFIDTKGNQAFDKHFTKCPQPFFMGYSLVQKTNGTYVYINKEGTVCSEEYKRATSFYPNGLAFAMIDHKTKVVIDCNMNKVSSLQREIFGSQYFNGVYWNGSNTFFDYKGDELTIRTGNNGSLKSVSDNGLIYLKSQDGMYDKPIEGFIDCTTGKYRFIFEKEEF